MDNQRHEKGSSFQNVNFMSVITKIEKQKKHKNRFSIFVDDEFLFGVSENTLVQFGLRKNLSLDENLIKQIKDSENFVKQWNYALLLLSYNDRSVAEIEKRLKQRKVGQEDIKKILNKLKDYNLVNDKKYVLHFLENKKSRGYYYFYSKFIEKGLKKEFFSPLIKEFFNEHSEFDRAYEVAEKKMKQFEQYSLEKQKTKLFSFLSARGFSNSIVFKVLNSIFKKNYE